MPMKSLLAFMHASRKSAGAVLAAVALAAVVSLPAKAQPSARLDRLVGRVALYPDPLLAQVLTASTYPDQIPDAAAWADQHSYLKGDELTRAISEDNLPWDPSVLGLLPFPGVLDMMSQNMAWTDELGNAVLRNRDAVMDAIQHMRELARNEGYLRTNGSYRVVGGPGDIEILPVSPGYWCVPTYNPLFVFGGRRAGVSVGSIGCGPSAYVGGLYNNWGYGRFGFHWHDHDIIIGHRPWRHDWEDHGPYARSFGLEMPRFFPGPREEHHHFEHHSEHEHGDHGHDHGRDHDHGH
jgi:hypothetical protein